MNKKQLLQAIREHHTHSLFFASKANNAAKRAETATTIEKAGMNNTTAIVCYARAIYELLDGFYIMQMHKLGDKVD